MPEPDLLYHYCSNSAFHSIIEKKTIWLSLLSLGNDSMEGKLFSEIMIEMAKEDGLNETEMRRLTKTVLEPEKTVDVFGFCLSEKDDSLGQWCRYADDATGVAIGFSKSSFKQTIQKDNIENFLLKEVEYEKQKQKELLKPIYDRLKDHIKKYSYEGWINVKDITSDQNKAHSNIRNILYSSFDTFCIIKHKAFQEERELRFIYQSPKDIYDESLQYHPSADKIIPHRELEFKDMGDKSPIVKVYLGPKNKTPINVIKSFLEQNKFKDVDVEKSKIPYR